MAARKKRNSRAKQVKKKAGGASEVSSAAEKNIPTGEVEDEVVSVKNEAVIQTSMPVAEHSSETSQNNQHKNKRQFNFRTRPTRSRPFLESEYKEDEDLSEEDIQDAIAKIDSAVEVNSSPKNLGRRKRATRSRTGTDEIFSDVEIDIDVDESQGEDKTQQKGPPKKRGRKRVPSNQAFLRVRKSAITGEEMDEEEMAQNEKYLSQIQAPRSQENEKYKHIYDTIPKLRSVSPPRFSTKGVEKKKLNCEELGIRVVGKTIGNPFSHFGKKRNGIVFGNQPLKTLEDVEKFSDAAMKVKKALSKQAETVRLTSYVQPQMLKKARDQHVVRRGKRQIPEEDVDVDIETVDDEDNDQGIVLQPESAPFAVIRPRQSRGRKPGRTILECQDCGYKTTHSGHMKIHIVCVHKDIKLLECQYSGCGYQCARKGSMTRHEKCVHRKDKVFKCDLCPFQSAWSVSLERHIITKHEKLRPWTCQICKKSFGQQFTLTQHMNTVHRKMKRIRCAFCSFRSYTKVSVRSHILRMHKDEVAKAVTDAEDASEDEVENGQETETIPVE